MLSVDRDPGCPGGYRLESEMVLDCPLERVFAFFGDATNLEQITPPWLHFEVTTPTPIDMFAGQLIDYRLKLHGLPLRWRTEIERWDPPHRFVDRQLRGPYRYWIHEHLFDEVAGGTRCRDVVRFAVPGGALVHRAIVRRDVLSIFAYRQQVLQQTFGKRPAG